MQSPPADHGTVAVLESAFTVEGFEEWMCSDRFPDEGGIDLCCGEVLVDMSPERVESHVKLKGEIYGVLRELIKRDPSGDLYGDGATFTHEPTGLVTQPDALYFSFDSFRSGQVQGGAKQDKPLGFRGTIDWVLEVVSPSSRTKDRKNLFAGYAKAGIREYWIADASTGTAWLKIFCLGEEGYASVHLTDGWQSSAVFGKEFRLEQRQSPIDMIEYDLRVR